MHPSTMELLRESARALYQAEGSLRMYHTWQHVSYVYSEFCTAFGAQSTEDSLAIWYHDCVYHPGNATNEQLSASVFRRICSVHNIAQSDVNIDDVCTMIENTTFAQYCDPQYSKKYGDKCSRIADADLSELAKPYDQFVQGRINALCEHLAINRRAVRAVSDHVDAMMKSAQFLAPLLQLPTMYKTRRGVELWERAARYNIEKYMFECTHLAEG